MTVLAVVAVGVVCSRGGRARSALRIPGQRPPRMAVAIVLLAEALSPILAQPQLASQLVGVAPAPARCIRDDRTRRHETNTSGAGRLPGRSAGCTSRRPSLGSNAGTPAVAAVAAAEGAAVRPTRSSTGCGARARPRTELAPAPADGTRGPPVGRGLPAVLAVASPKGSSPGRRHQPSSTAGTGGHRMFADSPVSRRSANPLAAEVVEMLNASGRPRCQTSTARVAHRALRGRRHPDRLQRRGATSPTMRAGRPARRPGSSTSTRHLAPAHPGWPTSWRCLPTRAPRWSASWGRQPVGALPRSAIR